MAQLSKKSEQILLALYHRKIVSGFDDLFSGVSAKTRTNLRLYMEFGKDENRAGYMLNPAGVAYLREHGLIEHGLIEHDASANLLAVDTQAVDAEAAQGEAVIPANIDSATIDYNVGNVALCENGVVKRIVAFGEKHYKAIETELILTWMPEAKMFRCTHYTRIAQPQAAASKPASVASADSGEARKYAVGDVVDYRTISGKVRHDITITEIEGDEFSGGYVWGFLSDIICLSSERAGAPDNLFQAQAEIASLRATVDALTRERDDAEAARVAIQAKEESLHIGANKALKSLYHIIAGEGQARANAYDAIDALDAALKGGKK